MKVTLTMTKITPEILELMRKFGLNPDDEGRTESEERCPKCGQKAWVKSSSKPFRWESDVRITTFFFICKNCGAEWKDYDSD